MRKGYIGEVYNTDRIRVQGSSYGYGDSNPHLIARGKRHLLIQKKGTQDWGQRGGPSSSYPAQWWLVQVQWLGQDRFKVLNIVVEREPGPQWRAAKRELEAQFTKLEAAVDKEKPLNAREMRVLEQAFQAEITGGRFQSKSKLALSLVEKGFLEKAEERRGAFHCEWLVLTHPGRILYCMSCEDVPDSEGEP